MSAQPKGAAAAGSERRQNSDKLCAFFENDILRNKRESQDEFI